MKNVHCHYHKHGIFFFRKPNSQFASRRFQRYLSIFTQRLKATLDDLAKDKGLESDSEGRG